MELYYSKGYKYQVKRDFHIILAYFNNLDKIETEYARLENGVLEVFYTYSFDGASGPTVDTENSMIPSLVHDVLYQLMREGHISFKHWKKADKELYRLLRKKGMSWFRAKMWMTGLAMARGSAAKFKNKKKILVAK